MDSKPSKLTQKEEIVEYDYSLLDEFFGMLDQEHEI